MAHCRHWKIYIPVRPKAVQAVRGARGHFHADRKVRKWKETILPYIVKACRGQKPSKLPIRATGLRYYFKAPESTKPEILEYIKAGGHVPYLGQSDLTDNLNKGLIDVCKGHIFEDDSQIWWVSGSMKLYGLEDHIELEFEETPDIINIKGVACNVDSDKVQIDRDSLI